MARVQAMTHLTRRELLLLFLGILFPAWSLRFPSAARADDDDGDNDDSADDHEDDNDEEAGDDNDHEGGDGKGGQGDNGHDDDDDNDDHEYAWRQRERGRLRALDDILRRIRRRYGGQVLEVKLRRRKGRAYYEIRILDSKDRVRKLRVPASNKVQNFRAGRR